MKKEIEIKIELSKEEYDKLDQKNNNEKTFERTYGFFSSESVEKGIFPRIKEIETNLKHQAILGVKKKRKEDTSFFERDEVEINIDSSNIQHMIDIFKLLEYSDIRVFDKERKEWIEDDAVSVCLDKLSLGYFIEFEGEKNLIEEKIKQYGLENNKRIVGAYLKIANEKNIRNPLLKEVPFEI
jgi:adenylate cyclase class IV